MQNASKPSGAKVTSSFSRRFNQSLFRLTLFYAAILAVILFISGAVTYSAFSSRIGRRFYSYEHPELHAIFAAPFVAQQTAMPTVDEVRADLVISLVVVNGLLFFIAGVLSYWLAKQTLSPIKEAYDMQQQFLSDASHELRTPLSILHVDLENELSDSTLRGIARERAVSNLEEVRRMNKIVGDLLLLSRLDENGENARKNLKPVDLGPLVQSIFKRLEGIASAHRVSLKFPVPHNADANIISPTIFSDEDLLAHALTNVIQNAILYNKPGGAVEVGISGETKAGYVCIAIADTGVGMSQEDLANIFHRFYRSDKSRSRQSGGSGLGLSIAQSCIEKVGGIVSIDSEIDKGTTVIVCLPAA